MNFKICTNIGVTIKARCGTKTATSKARADFNRFVY